MRISTETSYVTCAVVVEEQNTKIVSDDIDPMDLISAGQKLLAWKLGDNKFFNWDDANEEIAKFCK